MIIKQKGEQWSSSPNLSDQKKRNGQNRGRDAASSKLRVLERENFSLEIQAIRPSAVFGTRRITALRREGYAWTPDL